MKNGICEVCGSIHKVQRYKNEIALCNKHYMQMLRNGKIKQHSRNDPNDIIVKKDHAEIVLYNKNGDESARALIDIEDIEKVRQFKWYTHNKRKYVVSINNSKVQNYNGLKRLALHRLILNPPDNMVIDHINHNILDNRKSNLKICTQKENCNNKQNAKIKNAILASKERG